MEAVTIHFAPTTGTEEEWNEAYARLADYFRSYRLHNRIRRTQLILETLRRAADAHAKDPVTHPDRACHRAGAADAARVARGDLQGHGADGLADRGVGPAGISPVRRAGPLAAFLSRPGNLPPDMTEAMRSAVRTSGPRLQISKMTPRAIDLGRSWQWRRTRLTPWGASCRCCATHCSLVFVVGVLWYVYWLLTNERTRPPATPRIWPRRKDCRRPASRAHAARRSSPSSSSARCLGTWLMYLVFWLRNGMRWYEIALLIVFVPLFTSSTPASGRRSSASG